MFRDRWPSSELQKFLLSVQDQANHPLIYRTIFHFFIILSVFTMIVLFFKIYFSFPLLFFSSLKQFKHIYTFLIHLILRNLNTFTLFYFISFYAHFYILHFSL